MKIIAVSLALLGFVLVASSNAAQDFNTCAACEFYTGALLGQVGSDRNPQHIGERLDSLCNVLPTFARPGCNNWVAQYKPTIIAAISTGSTAGALCRSIRACQPANKVPRVSFDEFKSLDNNTGNCDVCAFIMTEVIVSLKNNDTQANIIATLHWVCDFLPIGQDTCKAFISQNLPELIKYLSEGDSATQICGLLGYCHTNQQIDIELVRAQLAAYLHERENPARCQLCRFVESAVGKINDDMASLGAMCDSLGPFANECRSSVRLYGLDILAAIKEGSQDACSDIGVCTNANIVF